MVLDIITLLIVAFGFYQGFANGLIKTVFASLSLLIAIVAALKLSPTVIKLLQKNVDINEGVLFVIGFVLTFIGTMALVRFLGNKLDKLSKTLQLSSVNKLLGGALLGLFYAVLISIGVYFANKVSLISEQQKSASFTYALLEPLPRMTQNVGEALKPMFNEFWNSLLDTMDAIKEKGDEMSDAQGN
ncbi:MAG: CvpA family protein [Saprospiraceae bacterium]|nr:CvpA family protein [Bacteroidia bacterium]NNE15844.1 CvpA family protein [Saprospiraceae bacterium]NNL92901.1 CvpA family protein [Saprospiraceae bacterium]